MAIGVDDLRFFIAFWSHCTDADARQSGRSEGRSPDAQARHGMNPWPFIIAAYGLTGLGTIVIIGLSYAAMRRAEKKADDL